MTVNALFDDVEKKIEITINFKTVGELTMVLLYNMRVTITIEIDKSCSISLTISVTIFKIEIV